MATLGIKLPSENPFPNLSTTGKTNNIFLPKFKLQSSTARNNLVSFSKCTQSQNPQTHLITAPKSAKLNQTSKYLEAFNIKNDIIDDPLCILDKFIVSNPNNIFHYDCKQIHGLFIKLGGGKSSCLVKNKLAIMYLRGGESVDAARRLFDEILQRSLPLYTKLIGSYCRCEQWDELFFVLGLMINDGMSPDKYVVPTILKACSALKLLRFGEMIHGYVVRKGVGGDVFIGNVLIDMYANCGELRLSKSVFDLMEERDVVSWTALVTAYMDAGLIDEAEVVFRTMELNGVKPDLISLNALVSGYARNGEIDLAIHYLEDMQEKGLKLRVTSWNGIISGCVQNGYFEDGLDLFARMLSLHENSNAVTIACVLSACAGLKDLRVGRAIHAYAIKSELSSNIHVEGSLVDMYSKCRRIDLAETIFVHVQKKNTTLWNEMIAVYVNERKMEAALGLLKSMQDDGFKPDEVTYNTLLGGHARDGNKNDAYRLLFEMICLDLKPNVLSFNVLISGFQQSGLSYEALKVFQVVQSDSTSYLSEMPRASLGTNPLIVPGALAACADLCLLRQGKEIHGHVLKNGFQHNIFACSALVDMYAKCHDIASATGVFRNMKSKNTVAWNSLIMGYIKNKEPEKALKLFREMLCEGFHPSSISFHIIITACADMGAFNIGRAMHGYIAKTQITDTLASVLMDMYAKCGCDLNSKRLYDSVNCRS